MYSNASVHVCVYLLCWNVQICEVFTKVDCTITEGVVEVRNATFLQPFSEVVGEALNFASASSLIKT